MVLKAVDAAMCHAPLARQHCPAVLVQPPSINLDALYIGASSRKRVDAISDVGCLLIRLAHGHAASHSLTTT